MGCGEAQPQSDLKSNLNMSNRNKSTENQENQTSNPTAATNLEITAVAKTNFLIEKKFALNTPHASVNGQNSMFDDQLARMSEGSDETLSARTHERRVK